MKRCYFIGCDRVYDSMLKHQMYEELEKVIKKETGVEFWFPHLHNTFDKMCLFLVLKLKKNYPNKDIKIVRLHDPTAYDEFNRNSFADFKSAGFPNCFPDKHIFFKRLATVEQKNANEEKYYRLMDNWIIKNCDYIFTYYYPLINMETDKQIQYAKQIPNITVISFAYEETNNHIQNLVESLDDQTKEVFYMLNDGKTYKEISKNLDLSYQRVHTLLNNGRKHICQKMKANDLEWKYKECICALVGLKNNPSIPQLLIFNSLIWFLVNSCYVNEFLIEKEYLYTTYAATLFQFAHDNAYLNIKIRVIIGSDDNKDEWKKIITEFEPLYTNVISLKSESNNMRSLYEEIIQACDYLALDFTSAEAPLVRELSMKNNELDLFDISYKGLKIDDQYIDTDIISD